MGSSELSDALNPNLSQRSRNSATYSPQFQAVVQTPQQHYAPHRSELELAIAEPPSALAARSRPSSEGVQAVQELLRIVSQTSLEQEAERKRRIAWEQEQEQRYQQRQAEMEKQVSELKQEVTLLRSALSIHNASSGSPTMFPMTHSTPSLQLPTPTYSSSPISPVSQHSDITQPVFVQGSSTQSLPNPNNEQSLQQANTLLWKPIQQHDPSPIMHSITPSTSTSPAPSPRSVYNRSSTKKRRKTVSSSSDSDSDHSRSSSSSSEPPVARRRNNHDKRCYTIHKAMRTQILHSMELETDKELPDSHQEGITLETSQPVRFVWDKTPKQSVHNARMKKRILADLKSNRRKYKHVSEKEFSQKSMDAAFDQCFTTFRQKFKAQRDTQEAKHQRKRDDVKAQKARRLSRKKTKLNGRSEARLRIAAFEHVTFDGALQLECMSSEESDEDETSTKYVRTHGQAWRSSRMVAFFAILDEEDRSVASQIKRGVGRLERVVGSSREGLQLPPKGVASWMLSKRWLNDPQNKPPDFHNVVEGLVEDPAGFDWNNYHDLGNETEDEQQIVRPMMNMVPQHQMQPVQMPMSHYTTTSSLHYALS
ncbi:hypothetical protein D9758_004736 [Tetrapyrgos nigripes]|uniref:Uncharacterized protein n=1 Tax=Tetrapyrgos nigripes TaxID=182062 RepID=A0A8H5LJ14_9AGAR|nr:hypothetical protein D9758_004736 [Tetrapyrgos nigripes]